MIPRKAAGFAHEQFSFQLLLDTKTTKAFAAV